MTVDGTMEEEEEEDGVSTVLVAADVVEEEAAVLVRIIDGPFVAAWDVCTRWLPLGVCMNCRNPPAMEFDTNC